MRAWRDTLAGVLFVAVAIGSAEAAPLTGLPDRFSIRAGGFLVRDTETIFRADSDVGLGTLVDAEKLLGMSNNDNVARLDAYVYLATHHRLDLSWYAVRLRGSKTLQQDIEFGDEVFPAGFGVESLLAVNTYKISYSYSFYRNEKVELGLGIGAHVQDLKVRLNTTSGTQSETEDLTAPLPVFGFRLDYAITRRLFAKTQLQFFVLEYETYDGRLTDLEIDLEYRLFRHLAFGVGYNGYNLEVEADKGDFTGKVDHSFNGLLFYGALYF